MANKKMYYLLYLIYSASLTLCRLWMVFSILYDGEKKNKFLLLLSGFTKTDGAI